MNHNLRDLFAVSIAGAFLTLSGGAKAATSLVGPAYSATINVNQLSSGVSTIDLSGLFETDFVLANSNGTQTFTSNGTINLTGPGGISFSQAVVDTGYLPVGSGYVQARHSTAFDFLISLTTAQQALFLGNGATPVTVSLTNYSTTGPTSSTAFYAWSVQNLNAVAPVPEPGEWLLMLCGLGLIGFIATRRKNETLDMPMAA